MAEREGYFAILHIVVYYIKMAQYIVLKSIMFQKCTKIIFY